LLYQRINLCLREFNPWPQLFVRVVFLSAPQHGSMATQTNLTWPENKKERFFIPSPTRTTSHAQTYERTSPQATTSSGAEGRSPSKPSRPPRKNQRSSPPMSTQSRKRQPSTHDRPLEARLKIKRPPKGESVDLLRPSSNRFTALQGTWRACLPLIRTSVTCRTFLDDVCNNTVEHA